MAKFKFLKAEEGGVELGYAEEHVLYIENIEDVDAASPNEKDVLRFDSGSGNWINKPEFGSWYEYYEDTSSFTTSSTSPQQSSTFTATSVPAGTYRVMVFAVIDPLAARYAQWKLQINGSDAAAEVQVIDNSLGNNTVAYVTMFANYTAASSGNITVSSYLWSSGGLFPTVEQVEAYFELWRLY